MHTDPLADNRFETRADAQRAVRALLAPLADHASPGGARLKPGPTGADFPDAAAELEGFSRPLWALAPLAAGGGAFDAWDRYRRGLANGTDPDHPEYWGPIGDYDQRAVESAAIGVALALVPGRLWDPLDEVARANVAEWLAGVNDATVPDNNWRFFRVLANAGLSAVGADRDAAGVAADLDRLEEFYLDDGWYSDGSETHCDYYSAWELQVDGLVYATLSDDADPERCERIRERAAAFAPEFAAWFDDSGAALPYGRSLTYRFAQSAFWGALAFADVEPDGLSWGEVRGLWARNLRWWAEKPIFTDGGVLTVGYAYPTLKTAESYNSPSSPYWATKAFLPLAIPESHPFWTAEEADPPDLPSERVLEPPEMILQRDRSAGVVALTPGSGHPDGSNVDKYNKFAYSTAFGFAVADGPRGLAAHAPDNALLLTDDGEDYRTRADVEEHRVEDGLAYSRWRPWPDVAVETWLVPATPWHVRLHRLETDRTLESAEGGFPLNRSGDGGPDCEHREKPGVAAARYPAGRSGIRTSLDDRTGEVVAASPNANLLYPRTAVPLLRGDHGPGTHWLAAAAFASTDPADGRWTDPPSVARRDGRFAVTHDETLLAELPEYPDR